MFTSRAEYRLLLRHDNADRRLTPIAGQLGLVGRERLDRLDKKQAEIDRAIARLDENRVDGVALSKYLRRPEVSWQDVVARLPELASISDAAAGQVATDLKYAGYVARQQADVDRQRRLADKRIPSGFDYETLFHLRTEAREKLCRVRPKNLAQASRISGITPADIALLLVHLSGDVSSS